MLAVQHPGMASGHPPSGLPFGYSMDPPQDFLLQDAPDAPLGAPLLSENDQKNLHNFFENIKSNEFDVGHGSYGENDGYVYTPDWLTLPPSFMGTTTSFGQQSALSVESPIHGFPSGHFHDMMPPSSMMMPPPPPQPHPSSSSVPMSHLATVDQQHSEDVLAAAALLQNGSMPRLGGTPHEPLFGRELASSLGPPVGHLRHQPLADFRKESQTNAASAHDNTFRDMMFGSASASRQVPPKTSAPMDVHWGSDANFGTSAVYQPQSHKETGDAIAKEHLKYMDCLSQSATTTGPSSPLLNGDSSPLKLKTKTSYSHDRADDHQLQEPPRKRRKSRVKEEAEDYDDDGVARPPRKRRSKVDSLPTTPPSEGSGRQRKASSAAKQPRENLSESQKRENHIKSEQKRRTLIKEGFDDLCDLVPGLSGGGFSKSTMLAMAADWLADLLQGNAKLQEQRQQLGGQ